MIFRFDALGSKVASNFIGKRRHGLHERLPDYIMVKIDRQTGVQLDHVRLEFDDMAHG
ncbi:hypothetical protein NG900_16165 [Ralstonia sp. 21MJYT02-11]|uniref:Uncharacterized protein n=1 Tax=Ralstonia soli TaxID=2953896 RepID=A0ABT1AMS4_9RALS|nr:hypothetical protein [Ralstonia soli]MCO5399734.1 hypothetical protein [Ralstonia soli]